MLKITEKPLNADVAYNCTLPFNQLCYRK